MDISCDIIRDLLPLYAEDMASNASRELVEEHLEGCDPCKKELELLKQAQKLPVDVDTHALERVSKEIRKRKILTVLCVIATIFSLIWSGVVFMFTPIVLSYEDAVESVELREDGALAIDFARVCAGVGRMANSVSEIDFFFAHTTPYDWLCRKWVDWQVSKLSEDGVEDYVQKRYSKQYLTQEDWDRFYSVQTYYCFVNAQGNVRLDFLPEMHASIQEQSGPYTPTEHMYSVWYIDGNGTLTILWDGGEVEINPVIEGLRWNDVGKYYFATFLLSVAISVVALLVTRFLRCPKLKCLLQVLGSIAAGLAAALLIVSGFDFSDIMGLRIIFWDQYLLPVTVLLAITTLLWQWLYWVNHPEKH